MGYFIIGGENPADNIADGMPCTSVNLASLDKNHINDQICIDSLS